jgi:ABC-type glutathione transport system ATPase component
MSTARNPSDSRPDWALYEFPKGTTPDAEGRDADGGKDVWGKRELTHMDLQFAAELRNVTKFYGPFKAVDDVRFALPFGSIYGFLGQNGAGKTTTIRMILDIIKPTSGSLTVLGRPTALEVRHRIGYLPEEKGLYKKMKAWAVIAYFATLKGMGRKAAKKRAYELLEKYGLRISLTNQRMPCPKAWARKCKCWRRSPTILSSSFWMSLSPGSTR